MTAREELDVELDHLESMLPVWREKLRVEAQFWPQFTALAIEILARAQAPDLEHAWRRLSAILATDVDSPSQRKPVQ